MLRARYTAPANASGSSILSVVTIVRPPPDIFDAQRLADPQALRQLQPRRAPALRRAARAVTLRVLAGVLALLAAAALCSCDGGRAHTTPARVTTGRIEALREAQERAQRAIEAEGRAHASEAQREHEALRREAEREATQQRQKAP